MSKGMLGTLPLAALRGPRDTLEELLAGADGIRVLEELKRFNRREPCWVDGVKKPKPIPLLGKRTPVTVPIFDQSTDLETFFQTRTGLSVWGDFKTNVLQPALRTDRAALAMPTQMSRRTLNQSATDVDIEAKLGRNYQFSELAAALIIATLIELQPNGSAGPLLNKGQANLFYLPRCVVFVDWLAFDSKWRVDAYRRDVSQWDAGSQVFASN